MQLLTGLAELLDSAGVGTWSPGAPPPAGDVAITLIDLPQSPERIVCLTDYPIAADGRLQDVTIGVQVRVRGTTSPGVAADLRDGVFDALNGLGVTVLGTAPDQVAVSAIDWQSELPLGPDQLGRHERVINYYVRCPRPSARLE